jgi:hypothetical protein
MEREKAGGAGLCLYQLKKSLLLFHATGCPSANMFKALVL